MPRRKLYDTDDDARAAFERDLEQVGENLPDEEVGIEGADVGKVVRHKNGEEDEKKRFARELAEPHADVDTETVKDLDL